MANYANLKAAIDTVIKANGQQEITGTVLNQTLTAMVNSLGAGYLFMGVAIPSTNPGTPDQNVFYLAGQAGTYSNFGAITLQAGLSILKYNGTWSSETLFTFDASITQNSANPITSGAVFEKLKIDGGAYDVSAHNNNQTFASLSALLSDANLSTLIPTNIRSGGMSIKFIQTSDNKYVQRRLMADSFTTDVTQWQGEDEKPTPNSKNFIESGGVFNTQVIEKEVLNISSKTKLYLPETSNVITDVNNANYHIDYYKSVGAKNVRLVFKKGVVFGHFGKIFIVDNESDITNGTTVTVIKYIIDTKEHSEYFELTDGQCLCVGMYNSNPESSLRFNEYQLLQDFATNTSVVQDTIVLPEWVNDNPYVFGNQVQDSSGSTVKYYRCVQDTNSAALTDTTYWAQITDFMLGGPSLQTINIGGTDSHILQNCIKIKYWQPGAPPSIQAGEIWYNTYSRCLRTKNSDNQWKTIPYYEGAVYTYNNSLYVWNGSELVLRGAEVKVAENAITGKNEILVAGSPILAIDKELDGNSRNPIENKAIYRKFQETSEDFNNLIDITTDPNNNLFDKTAVPSSNLGKAINQSTGGIYTAQNNFVSQRIAVTAGQNLYFSNKFNFLATYSGTGYEGGYGVQTAGFPKPYTVPEGIIEIAVDGLLTDLDDTNGNLYISDGVNEYVPYGRHLKTSDGIVADSELPTASKDVYDKFVEQKEYIDKTKESLIENPEYLYAEVDAEGNGLRGVTKDEEVHFMPQRFESGMSLSKKAYESLMDSMAEFQIPEICDISFGEKEAVFEASYGETDTLDNERAQNYCIVKNPDGTYYMWYLAYGTGGYEPWNRETTASMAPYKVLFAHSSDGVNWTRGFPSGVTPPFNDYPASVKFTDNNGNVVNDPYVGTAIRVPDSEYPWRMISSEGLLTMYFSRDGFTWEKPVVIDGTQFRDTQTGVVLRNGMFKIYTRGWSGNYPPFTNNGYGSRIIVVLYCDLNGNLLCPAVPFVDRCSNYNAPLSVLDDRREILMPVLYQGEDHPAIANCYIVDGIKVNKIKVDNDLLRVREDDQEHPWMSIWFVGGIFHENNKFYMYYNAFDAIHNELGQRPCVGRLYRIEVLLKSNVTINIEDII